MFKVDYSKGREYLTKNGTDVIIMHSNQKFVFQPGSAYKDIKKERLPEKIFLEFLNKEASFSKEFIKHFQVTHLVDLID